MCAAPRLEGIFEQLQESPVFVLISVWGIEQAYLEPSGLTAEEKEAGRLDVQRAMRGVVEKKISQEAISAAIPSNGQSGKNDESADGLPPGEDDPPKSDPPVGDPERRLTDDEVRQMLAKLKQLADDAQVPVEPYTVDIGDAMKQVVDKALAGKE